MIVVKNYIYDLIQGIKEGTYDKYDSYIYDMDNIKRNAYYSYLDNGWVAILTIPYKTILAELNEFNLIFAVIIALCLVLTIILFFRDLHLNYKVQRTNDTVKVLGNFYYAIYRVDYKNGTYEMSDWEDEEPMKMEDIDQECETFDGKKIPTWALVEPLKKSMQFQKQTDGDKIFANLPRRCNLEAVFGTKSIPYYVNKNKSK